MKINLKRILALITAPVSVIFCLQAQVPDFSGYYAKPLAIEPLTLSGSMGEFRATHFHTGLDFRVGGVSGVPVFSVADGYISRITVSPGGYGNALQITHPNGTVSLYGHLEAFAPAVASYVEEIQYERQIFEVSLDCAPDQFPVRKGQQIGKAGNTGDSAGPHLHFEIRYRDSLYEHAMVTANLLQYCVYDIEDTLPPEFRVVHFYGFSTRKDGISQTRLIAGFQGNRNNVTVNVPDTFFVAVDAIDRMNNTWSRMGIEKWEFFLDNSLFFRYSNMDLPLDQTRYILSQIYYPERSRNGRTLLKTWIDPGNVMKERIFAPTEGLLTLSDTIVHNLSIKVYDAAGNVAERKFKIRKRNGLDVLVDREEISGIIPDTVILRQEYQQYIYWNRENHFVAEDICIELPERALYRDILFVASRVDDRQWCLHTSDDPLHLPMTVAWKVPGDIPRTLHEKILVLRQSDKGRDPHMQAADPRSWRPVGGDCRDNVVTFRTNAFGRFMIAVDTIPPTISASFARGADLRGRRSVYFTIKDECSGIASYSVFIDGNWILGVHDGKRSRITCRLDSQRIRKGIKHQVLVKVVDNKNNVTEFNTEFLW